MTLRLRTLLASTFAIMAALAVMAALAMVSLARAGQWSASYLVASVRSVESAERIALDLHELQHMAIGASADAAAQSLVEDVAANRALIQSADEEAIIVRLEKSVAELLAARLNSQHSEGDHEAFQRALANAHSGQNDLLLINLHQARGAEQLTTARAGLATRIAMLVAAALVLAMIALILVVRAYLIRPLEKLRESIQRLSMGESGVRAPKQKPLELQELASTFNSMAALIDEQRRGRAEILGRVGSALEAPLASLRAQLERFSPAFPPLSADELAKLHALVVRQSLQLERRVGEFLDAARADAGELSLQRSECDLRELAREVVELFRGLSPIHQIELVAPLPLSIVADAARLEQVLHALFALALRRAPGGGRVEVRLHARGETAVLIIAAADASAAESFEALFNDLRRLDDALRDVPGVLFGLGVSRKLVEGHGGSIEVDPAGTRFVLQIPRRPETALAAPARSSQIGARSASPTPDPAGA